jgi:hypothetical protein
VESLLFFVTRQKEKAVEKEFLAKTSTDELGKQNESVKKKLKECDTMFMALSKEISGVTETSSVVEGTLLSSKDCLENRKQLLHIIHTIFADFQEGRESSLEGIASQITCQERLEGESQSKTLAARTSHFELKEKEAELAKLRKFRNEIIRNIQELTGQELGEGKSSQEALEPPPKSPIHEEDKQERTFPSALAILGRLEELEDTDSASESNWEAESET